MKRSRIVLFIIVLLVFLSGALVYFWRQNIVTNVSTSSQFGRLMSFSYPSSWVVDSDPVGFPNVDPLRAQSVIFRSSPDASPDLVFRFWDNPNGVNAQMWAKNAALEAQLNREPVTKKFGTLTFWLLPNALGPVPSQTYLYLSFRNRILQIEIDPRHVSENIKFDSLTEATLISIRINDT